jgi:hypothetical protein
VQAKASAKSGDGQTLHFGGLTLRLLAIPPFASAHGGVHGSTLLLAGFLQRSCLNDTVWLSIGAGFAARQSFNAIGKEGTHGAGCLT